jgi:acetyl esterase/lipase
MSLPVVPADHRLSYGTDSQQFGDLYLPEQDGPYPVVVLVHGGCWLAEVDLTHVSQMCNALADEGLAVWSLEYRRLGNGGGWPSTFEDVSAGADYLRQISDQHALELSRVVAAGHSAGGHLALWLACRRRLPLESVLYTANPLPLHGVVSLAGIPNLEQAVAQDICEGTPQQLIGGLPSEVQDRYRQASPSTLLPLGIPQILIIGNYDAVIPVDYIKHYAEAAEQKGDDIRLDILPKAGHFEIVVPTTPEWITVKDAIFDLLER